MDTLSDKVLALLRTDNPNEPSGEWSVYALFRVLNPVCCLAEPSNLSQLLTVMSDLRAQDLCSSGRYVGGTSGTLYFSPPHGQTMLEWNAEKETDADPMGHTFDD